MKKLRQISIRTKGNTLHDENIIYFILQMIIAIFIFLTGLLYIVLKHGVDRYNIYFAYKPSKLHKKIHNTAINFMIFGVIVLQFNIFYYILSASKPNGKFVFWTTLHTLVCDFAYKAIRKS